MALDRTWYNTLVDDDGSNTVGTIWNKAAVDSLMDAVDAAIPILPTTLTNHGVVIGQAGSPLVATSAGTAGQVLTSNGAGADPTFQTITTGGWSVVNSTVSGTQNDYAPTLTAQTLINWTGTTALTITGIAGGSAGYILIFKNNGTQTASFVHGGASSAANRFSNIAQTAATPVSLRGFVVYQHNGTDWRLVGHDQGAFITPAYAAGDFTASGSMTWTVDSGDITVYAYRLAGKMLAMQFAIISTTVGGTVSNNLRIKIPGGFTNTKYVLSVSLNYSDNGSGNTAGFLQVGAGNTYIECYKFSVANWTLATNATGVYGEIFFEVD